MTGASPRYDDEEFLAVLTVYHAMGDEWVGTHLVAEHVGCQMGTANRRMLDLALEKDIQVYDPEVGEGEAVEPESFDDAPRRLLGFRLEPLDPESAPDYLDTGHKTL